MSQILRKRIVPELRRRTRTRVLDQPWPFLFSVVDGETFKNLPAVPKSAKKSRKPMHRRKISESA